MEQLFGAKALNLTFAIEVVSSTKYYIYTTDVYLGERGKLNWLNIRTEDGKPTVPIGQYIYAIYRTEITRPNTNSDWEIKESRIGQANQIGMMKIVLMQT
jgi:hypothetical protein